jgi:glycosyltransferase involved in cell wall biosynthesis
MTTDATLAGKRVVFVVAWAVLGGAERQAFNLMRHLQHEQGASVEVLALTGEHGRFREAVKELGVPWHPFPVHWTGSKPAKLATLANLALRLRRMRPDVLVPYTTRPNVLCGLVWRLTGASLCVWNQQDLARSTKFSPRLVSRAARSSSLLVASSRAAADFLVSELGAPRDRVRVILNTVELAAPVEDRSAWRHRLGVRDEIVATMLAHFTPGKDHATLLRSWRLVLDQGGGSPVLVLAGRAAGTEHQVKALAFDLELGRSVRFLSDVRDAAGLLSASDIAVLSSPSEGAPNSLLESAVTGLPVVATDVPGIREVLSDRQLDMLAPVGDAEALAARLLELIASPERRRELGRENRRVALDRASVPAAVRIVDAIKEAAGRRGARRRSGR